MTRAQLATTLLRRCVTRTEEGIRQDLVITLLAEGPATLDVVRGRLKLAVNWNINPILVECCIEGLVRDLDGRFELTSKGTQELAQITGWMN